MHCWKRPNYLPNNPVNNYQGDREWLPRSAQLGCHSHPSVAHQSLFITTVFQKVAVKGLVLLKLASSPAEKGVRAAGGGGGGESGS